jgi:hypothetical protein
MMRVMIYRIQNHQKGVRTRNGIEQSTSETSEGDTSTGVDKSEANDKTPPAIAAADAHIDMEAMIRNTGRSRAK